MIHKPNASWQHESPVLAKVETAKAVASGAATVTRRAGSFTSGVICWAFALLWGFAALAGALFGGSLPTFFGVGAMAVFMAWSGTRSFAKARGHGSKTMDLGADGHLNPNGSGLRTIEYGTGRLFFGAIIYGALGCAGILALGQARGFTLLLVAIGTPILWGGAIALFTKLFSDRTALRYDNHAITVATLWSRRTILWSDITGIRISRIDSYGLYGLVRIAGVNMLVIHTKGGLFGDKKLSIMPKLLDLGSRTQDDLIVELHAASKGTAAFASAPSINAASAPARAVQPVTYPKSEAAFDPDAVMTRYLAEKKQAEADRARLEAEARASIYGGPSRRQFGRKTG